MMRFEWLENWRATDGGAFTFAVMRALLIVGLGLMLAKTARRVIDRLGGRLTPQQRMLLRRAIVYAILVLAAILALREVGFDLSVLLGAAGILTVAVGFASQTSMSNVISGLFLIGERPFVIGDTVRVGQTTGEVVEIGLVSVHIRTFDNVRVRIPNEQIFKSEITNFSQYPIRRLDVVLRVGHGEDLGGLRRALLDVAGAIPTVLDEPKPTVMFRAFVEDAVEFVFSVWCMRELLPEVQNLVYEGVHARLVESGVRMPSPHRSPDLPGAGSSRAGAGPKVGGPVAGE